ncbi:MAG: sensor domain-containing diguanylate cyclase [Spirochaetales bacterium]
MAKDIASARSVAETVEQVMRHVGRAFAPVNWSLLLRNDRTGELRFVHVTGEGAAGIRGLVLERGQGIAGWVAEQGLPEIVVDASKDSRFHRAIDEKVGFVTRSIIAVPLKARGRVYGVIELINKLDDSLFTELDIRVLQTIADLAAIAIERVYFLRTARRMALTDPLTGVANRRHFQRQLDREIEKTQRSGTLFSLLFIDINRFKAINDTHGHAAGDAVLKALAQLLTACCRKVDLCARLGGDEFAVLMPETAIESAMFLVRRIQNSLEQRSAELPVPFSVSVGARVVDPLRPTDILSEADRAMYSDKAEEPLEEVENHLVGYLSEDSPSPPKD